MKPKTEYTLGNGTIGIGAGIIKGIELPFISLTKLSKPYKIQTDLLKIEDSEKSEFTVIYVKNLEGLKVLEEIIKKTKQILKQQKKIID